MLTQTKHWRLCLKEKLETMEGEHETILNSINCQSELVSKCRFENKHYMYIHVYTFEKVNNRGKFI